MSRVVPCVLGPKGAIQTWLFRWEKTFQESSLILGTGHMGPQTPSICIFPFLEGARNLRMVGDDGSYEGYRHYRLASLWLRGFAKMTLEDRLLSFKRLYFGKR